MSKLIREVYPLPNGGWASKLEGNARASAKFPLQKDAIAYSRKRAKLEKSKVRILHRSTRSKQTETTTNNNRKSTWSLPGKQTIIAF